MKGFISFAVAIFFASSAHAAGPTNVQELCHEQAILIDQTYQFYRQGYSESDAYDKQVAQSASANTKSWMKKIIHGIYSDTRSLVVNVDATTFQYEGECNRNPGKYIRDKALIR